MGREKANSGTGATRDEGVSQPSWRDLRISIDRARRAVVHLEKNSSNTLSERLAALEKAIIALQQMESERVLAQLSRTRELLVQEREESLKRRREQLARSAKEAGCPIKRLNDFDYVEGFRVNYRYERVSLMLGTESLPSFKEEDGARLFARVQEEREKLESFPFVRQDFFESIKDAIQLAQRQGKDRDGKVPVRTLYPLLVLVRQSRDVNFMRRPVGKCFADYSMAQFVYDLARFGRDGWQDDKGERLRNQPPNMASISRRATVTLPSLDGDGSGGPQLGAVYISRT